MVSLLEQELTNEQVQWLKDHPKHKETTKIIIFAKVANWDNDKLEKEKVFKNGCRNFRKWWRMNKHIDAGT